MKVKDTENGLKGEAMRLMFNEQKQIFFDQYTKAEWEHPTSLPEWFRKFPETHFYSYHLVGIDSGCNYIGGLYGYVPKDPQKSYEALNFVHLFDSFHNKCNELLFGVAKHDIKPDFEAIVVEAEKLIKKYEAKNYLCGDAQGYTVADFAFIGTFLGLENQSTLVADVEAVLARHKDIKDYLYRQREHMLEHLIKRGRYCTFYGPKPYLTIFKLMMSTVKVRTTVVEAKEIKLTIAGLTYTSFESIMEMFGRQLDLIPSDESLFDILLYRNTAKQIIEALLSKKATPEVLGEPLYLLNNYYGYLRSLNKDGRWQPTLADIYSAVALNELCNASKELDTMLQTKFEEAYAFQKDFMMRHRRPTHGIVLRPEPDETSPLEKEAVELLKGSNFSRLDLHDVLRTLGFETAETIYVHLKSYNEELSKLMARKEHDDMGIYAYLDANEKSDYMVGYNGIKFLEDHDANFAGASAEFIMDSIDKVPMKQIFLKAGVPTAPFVFLPKWDEEAAKKANMPFPVLVKLTDGYASFGSTKDSKCKDFDQLRAVAQDRLVRFGGHPIFAESFIEGPEYTVVVSGIYNQEVRVYTPAQRCFDETIPEADRWFYFEFYWKSSVQKYHCHIVKDKELADKIMDVARRAYISVRGCGYGRVDIRQDRKTGNLYVLEVNSLCCVGFESSSFYVLRDIGKKMEDLFEDIFYYGAKHREETQKKHAIAAKK